MILDTNALSALAEGDGDLVEAIRSAETLYIPVIVLAELRFGISQSRRRRQYEEWLIGALKDFEVLPVLASTTVEYVEIVKALKKKGSPIPTNDIWIASLAREHSQLLVTRDQHFDKVPGLRIVTW